MMTAIPVHRPSSPSIRFIALVTPTIQRVVTLQTSQVGKDHTARVNGSVRWSIRKPKPMATAAAVICPASLGSARRL